MTFIAIESRLSVNSMTLRAIEWRDVTFMGIDFDFDFIFKDGDRFAARHVAMTADARGGFRRFSRRARFVASHAGDVRSRMRHIDDVFRARRETGRRGHQSERDGKSVKKIIGTHDEWRFRRGAR